jgi:lysophospholipase L1-like esterase
MRKYILLLLAAIVTATSYAQQKKTKELTDGTILYNTDFSDGITTDFVDRGAWVKNKDGITATTKGLNSYLMLNRQYSINTRKLSVKVSMGRDTKLDLFTLEIDRSHQWGTLIQVDVKDSLLKVYKPYNADYPTYPDISVEHHYTFIPGRDYTIEMMRDYYKNKFIIIDNVTGVSDTTVSAGQNSGLLRDAFAIAVENGAAPTVKSLTVSTQFKKKLKVLFIGDSITEGLSGYPGSFNQAGWSAVSGRSAGIVSGVQNRVLSEIAILKPKYVSIMIGTNGFSNVDNLTALCNSIIKLGSTPILNNITWKLPGSVVKDNEYIATVRKNLNLKGALFDVATSIDGLNEKEDFSLFYKDGIHPNALGVQKMFDQLKIDVPELFK